MARDSLATDDVVSLIDPEINIEDNDPEMDQERPYVMAADMSFPVPKKFGNMWKDRIDEAYKAYEPEHAKWDAVFEMFRKTGIEEGLNDDIEYKHHNENDADENVLRQVMQGIIRDTYMKNPKVEFSAIDRKEDQLVKVLELLTYHVSSKTTAPGVNLKPKARRWLLHALLTNFGVLKLDYQGTTGSVEEAREQLKKVEDIISTAKTTDEIDKAYAELELIYEEMPLLLERGMFLENTLPQRLIIDPNCTQPNLSDAWWVAEEVYLDNNYIDQKFYTTNAEDVKVFRSNTNKAAKVRENEAITSEETKAKVVETIMGDTSDERRQVIMEGKTRCFYIWDKLLRRIYLYSYEDWSQPLWVYEDELKLSRFFPFFILMLTTPIDGVVQAGEASQIVGQQKIINKINRKAQQIRMSVFGALYYNKKGVDIEEVKKLINHIKNPNEVEAFGIGLNEDTKLEDVLKAFAPPAFEHKDMFNTEPMRQAIDRATSQTEAQRGGEFKTNTTNKAVDFYNQEQQKQSGSITDQMEEGIEDLIWSMCEIFVSKYDQKAVEKILGSEKAAQFTPMTVEEFNQGYKIELAAGSLEKPTSQFKKQETLGIAQAMGQFASGAPMTSLRVLLRLFQDAFSNFQVSEEDWKALEQEMQANMQKGVSTNAQAVQ